VARPDNAAKTIDPIVLKAGAVVHSFVEFGLSPNAMPERYIDYGTEPFIAVNWAKVRYIGWLLERYHHVVYADIDVGWLADPLWYLDAIAKFFPLEFQTEGLRRCRGRAPARQDRTIRVSRQLDCRARQQAETDGADRHLVAGSRLIAMTTAYYAWEACRASAHFP